MAKQAAPTASAAPEPQTTAWVINHNDWPVAVVLTGEAEAELQALYLREQWIAARVRDAGEGARPAVTRQAYFHVSAVPVL